MRFGKHHSMAIKVCHKLKWTKDADSSIQLWWRKKMSLTTHWNTRENTVDSYKLAAIHSAIFGWCCCSIVDLNIYIFLARCLRCRCHRCCCLLHPHKTICNDCTNSVVHWFSSRSLSLSLICWIAVATRCYCSRTTE